MTPKAWMPAVTLLLAFVVFVLMVVAMCGPRPKPAGEHP